MFCFDKFEVPVYFSILYYKIDFQLFLFSLNKNYVYKTIIWFINLLLKVCLLLILIIFLITLLKN